MGIKTYTPADLFDLPEPKWLVKDLLEQAGVLFIVGEPGSYKTFFGIDMAMAMSTRCRQLFNTASNPTRDFQIERPEDLDFPPEQKQHRIGYIAAEGQGFLKRRIEAWMRYYKRGSWAPKASVASSLADEMQFILSPLALWRSVRNGTTEDLKDLQQFVRDQELTVLFIDTLHRATAGLNENSAEDMGAFIAGVDSIRAEGCAVVIIHHTTKDGARYRGSSSLEGAADTIVQLNHDEKSGIIHLVWKKQKNAIPHGKVQLKTVGVPFGRYLPSGDEISSIVLEPVPSVPAIRHSPLGATQLMVLKAIKEETRDEEYLRKRFGKHWKRDVEKVAARGLVVRNTIGEWEVA